MLKVLDNPPNPWLSEHVEWLGEPPEAKLEVFEERARSILSENNSPDVPFRWSVNPYRGCFHACSYCYARPTHQYIGFGAGSDFDRRLVVKVNAPELLREAFERPRWVGEAVTYSGITDCYQPLEATYALTRRCLEVCLAYRNPIGLITKSALVRRDVDLLAALHREAGATVLVSIPFANAGTARLVEPHASAPSQRFETLRILSEAGIPTGVAVAPIIPGLNDSDVPKILERAARAGAKRAFMMMLRLPAEVLPVFDRRIQETFPLRAEKIRNAIREVRGGRLYDPRFGNRMRGTGQRWEAIRALFDATCMRLGLNRGEVESRADTFRRPGSLFSEAEQRGPRSSRRR